jgi:hypothetical protein
MEVLGRLRYRNVSAPTDAELVYRTKFLQFFPDQLENINAYQENPGCRCVSKIVDSIQKDKEIMTTAINSLFEGEEVTLIFPRVAAGDVSVVNDDAAYKDLILSKMKNNESFRGLSVIPFGDKLKIFFY